MGKSYLHALDNALHESVENSLEANKWDSPRFQGGHGARAFDCKVYSDIPENGGTLKQVVNARDVVRDTQERSRKKGKPSEGA